MVTDSDPGIALPYRPCVGIALIAPSGGVFVGRRRKDAGPEHVDGPHMWQMPQGGIDPGEDAEAAARRELYEETNVPPEAVKLLAEIPDWLPYDLPPAVMKQAWKGRYRGQTQKWFAYGFVGSEDLIDVLRPGGGAHKAEFDAWRWARFSELPDLIVPFKRPVYERVVAAVAGLERGAAPSRPRGRGAEAVRWLAVPVALALAWLAFTMSPLWSLYDLAQAVRRHDAAYVESHVNFRTLRLSLVRQITAAMRAASETDPDLEPRDRQRLNDAAYGLALALAETMVTPETVMDLLANGWPDKLDLERPAGTRPEGLVIRGLGRLMPYYAALEMRGFRAVVIPIPPEGSRAERTRIRLRLRGLSWRLVDIEMAEMLRAQIAAKLSRALARAKIGASAGEER